MSLNAKNLSSRLSYTIIDVARRRQISHWACRTTLLTNVWNNSNSNRCLGIWRLTSYFIIRNSFYMMERRIDFRKWTVNVDRKKLFSLTKDVPDIKKYNKYKICTSIRLTFKCGYTDADSDPRDRENSLVIKHIS